MRLRRLRCSFCGKNADDVQKLVAGPRVYICDACVAVARRLMEDGPANDFATIKERSTMWQKLARHIRQILHGEFLSSINPSKVQ